jgi:CheY-like chemotaxis protein
MITVPTSAQTSTAMELSPEPEQARRGFTGRILLVENDALALEATTAALRGMGFTVESIGANQAFDLPRNQGWPDLIISDYHCSEGRNGVELVEALRTACGKKVPAIIVTGDTRSETLHHVRDAGLMLLHKPLNRDQLNAAIADALDAQPCRNSLETITTASVLLEAPSSLRTTVT